jgi:hypothetical protein
MTKKIVVNTFATAVMLLFTALFIGQILVSNNVYEQQQAHGQKEEEGMAKLFEQDPTETQQQPTTDE